MIYKIFKIFIVITVLVLRF